MLLKRCLLLVMQFKILAGTRTRGEGQNQFLTNARPRQDNHSDVLEILSERLHLFCGGPWDPILVNDIGPDLASIFSRPV